MIKILLIEDNPDILANLTESLELEGYRVIVAHGGEVGISLAQLFTPDLIICDVMMPEVDGFQVLQAIVGKQETSKVPFIFCSALTDDGRISEAMHHGADAYITKPFQMESLLAKVKVLLETGSKRYQEVH